MSHEPGTGPLPDPEQDPTASTLHRALLAQAEVITPGHRLDEVRARVGGPAVGRRRWQILVAVAATAAVATGIGLAAGHGGGQHPTSPAATRGQVTAPGPVPTSATGPPAGLVALALPVYYVGRDGTREALYREFRRVEVQDTREVSASVAPAELLALPFALDPGSAQDPDYGAPWLPGTRAAARISEQPDVVTVDLPLAEGTAHGRTREQARLAVQQLAWTVSAAAQDPALGVRLTIGGRPGKLFGSLATGAVAHRPPAATASADLAGIWVLTPDDGAAVRSPVTVSGTACVFEAALRWQLLRGGRVVRSGRTTAASGCPARGAWSVPFGTVPAGDYTFRAYALPASGRGGAAVGQDTKDFSVR